MTKNETRISPISIEINCTRLSRVNRLLLTPVNGAVRRGLASSAMSVIKANPRIIRCKESEGNRNSAAIKGYLENELYIEGIITTKGDKRKGRKCLNAPDTFVRAVLGTTLNEPSHVHNYKAQLAVR